MTLTCHTHELTHEIESCMIHTRLIYTYELIHTRLIYTYELHLWIASHRNWWLKHMTQVTWLIHLRDMTHSYVWHDSLICVTWLTHMCDMTHSYVCHDSLICVPWLIQICAMTHSCMWHDSLIRVTWLIHVCGMTHSYVWHDSLICVTWLTHMCDMTHSYVWHDSLKGLWNNGRHDIKMYMWWKDVECDENTEWDEDAECDGNAKDCDFGDFGGRPVKPSYVWHDSLTWGRPLKPFETKDWLWRFFLLDSKLFLFWFKDVSFCDFGGRFETKDCDFGDFSPWIQRCFFFDLWIFFKKNYQLFGLTHTIRRCGLKTLFNILW